MIKMTTDLQGREIVVGALPATGTRIVVNGNIFRINYIKNGLSGFRFSADLIEKYEPKNEGY